MSDIPQHVLPEIPDSDLAFVCQSVDHYREYCADHPDEGEYLLIFLYGAEVMRIAQLEDALREAAEGLHSYCGTTRNLNDCRADDCANLLNIINAGRMQ